MDKKKQEKQKPSPWPQRLDAYLDKHLSGTELSTGQRVLAMGLGGAAAVAGFALFGVVAGAVAGAATFVTSLFAAREYNSSHPKVALPPSAEPLEKPREREVEGITLGREGRVAEEVRAQLEQAGKPPRKRWADMTPKERKEQSFAEQEKARREAERVKEDAKDRGDIGRIRW